MLEITELGRIIGEMIGNHAEEPTSLNELEIQVEQLLRRVGREVLQQALEVNEEPDPNPTTRCRQCGRLANYVTKRAGFANTRFGLIRYHRATYICPHCYASTSPMDERLNPYKSLARLRAQIAAGNPLPVSKLAKAWGLGSLNGPKNKTPAEEQRPVVKMRWERRFMGFNIPVSTYHNDTLFADPHLEGGKSNGNPIS